MAQELVTGNERGLHPGGLAVVPPILGCAVEAFQVAGTDAAALRADDDVPGTAFRYGPCLFQPVVRRAVGDQCLHGPGQFHTHIHPLLSWFCVFILADISLQYKLF